MNRRRKGRRPSPPFSQGYWNALIDTAFHPLFAKSKGFIVIDGIAHGLVEKNPPLSARKFVQYNLPALLSCKKAPRGTSGLRKRHYTCTVPVSHRHHTCQRRKAGPKCLHHDSGRLCPHLTIRYTLHSSTQ